MAYKRYNIAEAMLNCSNQIIKSKHICLQYVVKKKGRWCTVIYIQRHNTLTPYGA